MVLRMPKIVDHDQYRKELLSQCLSAIAEKGYTAITMRQIAQELEVSTGTLYHYFPSKESLFEQLVEHITDQDTSEAVLTELSNLPTLSERVSAIFHLVANDEQYFIYQTLMLIDFGRQRSRDQINQHQTLQRVGKRYEKAVMRILGIEDPVFAMLLIDLIDGILVRRLYQGDRISFSDQAHLLSGMLAAYLGQQ